MSHKLMLRAGMIRQSVSGIYTWLPLGLRVLNKIEAIISDEMDRSGAHQLLMPTIQSADLWRQSGRYDSYGKEMLRIKDRHDRELLYGPTNEEVITSIFSQACSRESDVPVILYHTQWKFRDEIRPRFGVMRGREFYMKDAYSFDKDEAGATISYRKMFLAYLRSLSRLGLRPIPMRAENGPIGGDRSHEFVVLAETGESQVFCHADVLDMDPMAQGYDYGDDLLPLFQQWTSLYSATEDQHDKALFDQTVAKTKQISARGIEVGHIFYFADQYSKSFDARLPGSEDHLHMGSYGIGISRLVGAIIESSHDKNGIIWPESVAPFDIGIINIAPENAACKKLCDATRDNLAARGYNIIVDDRDERPGVKFTEMDLIGIPWRVVIAPRHAADGLVELKNRADGRVVCLTPEALMTQLTAHYG